MKYGQKVVEIDQGDGKTTIRTEGYFDGLRSVKEQIREDMETTHNTMLADVIKCLDVLKTTDTPELVILIKRDKYGSPNLIQRTWITSREKLK